MKLLPRKPPSRVCEGNSCSRGTCRASSFYPLLPQSARHIRHHIWDAEAAQKGTNVGETSCSGLNKNRDKNMGTMSQRSMCSVYKVCVIIQSYFYACKYCCTAHFNKNEICISNCVLHNEGMKVKTLLQQNTHSNSCEIMAYLGESLKLINSSTTQRLRCFYYSSGVLMSTYPRQRIRVTFCNVTKLIRRYVHCSPRLVAS